MNWKWNYVAALYFAVLAVVAFSQADWVWFGIDVAAAVGSGVIAERRRRKAKPLPPHTCKLGTHLPQEGCTRKWIHPCYNTLHPCTRCTNKESDGQAHREGDQGEAGTVAEGLKRDEV